MQRACVYSLFHKSYLSVMKPAHSFGRRLCLLEHARVSARAASVRLPGLLRLVFAVLLAGLLALQGCTPALDWREVRNEQAGYRALFPGKPVMASREFVMAGETVTLKLHATTAGGAYFAVGEIPLAAAQQEKAGDILAALKASLHQNVGAVGTGEKTVSIAGTVWQEVRATGQMKNGAPSVFAGRFLVQPGRIVEVIAMGEKALLSDDTIDLWFGSVTLEQRP